MRKHFVGCQLFFSYVKIACNNNSKAMSKKSKEPAGIGSVENGARLLACLADMAGLKTLTALASAAGMAPAKAHRYLTSLVRSGLVERDALTGRYRLGPLSRQIGMATFHDMDAIRLTVPRLPQIRDVIGETVVLVVWGHYGPTVVHTEEARRAINLTIRPGSVLPVLQSAAGRVFSAWLPRTATEQHIAHERAILRRSSRSNDHYNAQRFEAILDNVRKRGVARSAGEVYPGIFGLSTPIFDMSRSVVAALATFSPTNVLRSNREEPIARKLKAAGKQLTDLLAPPPSS